MKKPLLAIVSAAVLGCLSAPSAFAQATFNFSSAVTNCSRPLTVAYGNNETCTRTNASGATSVNISAWSTSVANQVLGAGGTFQSAALNDQGTLGFGAYNQTEGTGVGSPNHSVDNITPGFVDMVMLNFKNGSADMAVSLSTLKLGWTGKETSAVGCDITAPVNTTSTGCDSDISIFRWTGSAAGPTVSGTGAGETLSATAGWTLVGSYADFVSGTDYTVNSTTSASSSWWLISSFSSSLSGSTSCKTSAGAATTCDDGNDGFKILALGTAAATCAPGTSGTIGANGVCTPPGGSGLPEPGTLALMGVPLIGIALRRRRAAAQA